MAVAPRQKEDVDVLLNVCKKKVFIVMPGYGTEHGLQDRFGIFRVLLGLILICPFYNTINVDITAVGEIER